jgi:hypothetical protein
VFLARFAQLGADVDETGTKALAAAVDDFDAVAEITPADVRTEIGDRLAVGDQTARSVQFGRRIEQPGIDVRDWPTLFC